MNLGCELREAFVNGIRKQYEGAATTLMIVFRCLPRNRCSNTALYCGVGHGGTAVDWCVLTTKLVNESCSGAEISQPEGGMSGQRRQKYKNRVTCLPALPRNATVTATVKEPHFRCEPVWCSETTGRRSIFFNFREENKILAYFLSARGENVK
jgi:hypothetical protein